MKLSAIVGAAVCGLDLANAARPRHPASGCGTTHQLGFSNDTVTHSLESGGLTRTYAVNVPGDYNRNPDKARPLIIDYHGNGGTGWQQYENSQYFKYSAGQEYLAVYPQAFNGSWQGAGYSTPGVDDLQFTTDLVSHLKNEYCIDDSRIYASGKSNGGGFVDLLACSDHGDEFGAFAMAAPALYPDTNQTWCTKRRAIIDSHGDEDATIPYHPTEDGSGGPLPDISDWVRWWGHRTCGRHAEPQNSDDLGGYNTTTYSCRRYRDVIKHYQIFKLGHCWPTDDGSNWDASDNYNQTERKCLDGSVDFTDQVLDFFAVWNLRNAPRNRGNRGGRGRWGRWGH